ncbi:MAG TPA: HIT family protein [Abditibacteriaceae bacterium]|jgi:diadenosine tetraphosphate (Ap4A) HIT family hydrolase|nr:HIT family protein [Abditibacteriaceae bacterium]
MAQHQNPCAICERIEQARSGEHPGFILETETAFAVLGDSQFFRGYCLLLCKTPATELHELPRDIKMKYLEEMSLLAQVVQRVTQCHKINYEMLGNQVHHLHFHIFPRYANEENVLQPVWLFQPQGAEAEHFKLDEERDAPLVAELRTELKRLLAEPRA